jgi:hypothetical protein
MSRVVTTQRIDSNHALGSKVLGWFLLPSLDQAASLLQSPLPYYSSKSSTSRRVFPPCPLPSSTAAFRPAPRLLPSDTIWPFETVLKRVDVVQKWLPIQRRERKATCSPRRILSGELPSDAG